MKLKILVVEDNVALNFSILNMLNKENYSAFGACNLENAKKIFLEERPHIVLLDIMLPDGKGYESIKFFRKTYDCHIIMVTALTDEENKYISYENGADDYISKPFDLYELVYKLSSIRRRILSNLLVYNIGDITLNLRNNEITCNEKTFKIQPNQIKLLKALYEKYENDEYLHKKDVFKWLSEEVNESFRIQTSVARLRKNLVAIGSEKVIIETIYGKGYILNIIEKG